jgi:hypothetical protein
VPSNSFDNFTTDIKDEKAKQAIKLSSSPSNSKKLLNPDSLKKALQQNKALLSVKQSAYERKYMIGPPEN